MPRSVLTTDRRTRDMSRDAIEAIIAANDPPSLFARVEDNLFITRWGERVQVMDKALATHLGEHTVDWVKLKRGNNVADRMPPYVADDMLSQAPWADLPRLRRMVRSPIILPDARVLAASGYDAETGLYLALEPGFSLPSIPDEPTEDDLQRAGAYVRGFLDEFVFASQADAANALGLFIGHLLRTMIGDEALLPMFAIDAPIQSTGKTALANATGMLALGSPPKIVPEIKDADEMRKQVGAMLAGENELMLFDNLTRALDDASLAAVLTGEGAWGARLLGGNLLVNERTKLTVIVTGNNLEIGPDLRRRSIYIRLDANMADPSSRQFKRPDFLGMLRAARPTLLAAFFTWARRWLQLGSPVTGAPVLAGYNPFVRAVHGLLELVGLRDWLGNMARFRDEQDPEVAIWARWLGEWHRLWGSEPRTSNEIARALNVVTADYAAFSDLRPSDLMTYTGIEADKLPVTVGHVLGKHVGQIMGGFKLERGTLQNGYQRWRVVPLDKVTAAATPTAPPAPTEAPEETSRTRARVDPSRSVELVALVDIVTGSAASLNTTLEISHAQRRKKNTTNTTNTTEKGSPVQARAREDITYEPTIDVSRAHAMQAIDTETTGLRWWTDEEARLVTLMQGDRRALVDLWSQPEEIERLKELFAQVDGGQLIMHNAVFDLAMLQKAGVPLPPMHRVFDTMLASQMLDQGAEDRPPASLESLAMRYLGWTVDKTYQTSDWGAAVLSEEQKQYAVLDAETTLRLAEVLMHKIQQARLQRALDIEHTFIPFMIALASNGLPVDQKAWLGLEQHAIEERLRLEARMASLYPGTPPTRWTQKGWLEEYLQANALPHGWTAAGKPSLNKTSLEAAQTDPLIAAYLAWKPYEKRGSTWGTKFLREHLGDDGRFHGEYRQLGTRTGRLSCDKPNLQNIPRGPYRQTLHPGEGRCFIKADYSQLQLVIIADETLDPVMLRAYDPATPHGLRPDLHTITAKEVLGLRIPDGEKVKGVQRIVSKNINFGLCYGMGAGKLASMIERETGEECDIEIAKQRKYKYFQTYSGVKDWHKEPKHLSSRGQAYDDDEYPNPIDVRSPSGRRRSAVVKFTEKVNSPIQMREADGVKTGLALLLPRLGQFHDARPVMMIHDEVIVECDIDQARDVAQVVASSLEEGMNRWLEHTTATVEVDSVKNYAGDPL